MELDSCREKARSKKKLRVPILFEHSRRAATTVELLALIEVAEL
jgi:hypothetical protein